MGDSWNCDVKGIVKDLTKGAVNEIDAEKATGTGKLKEVYQKDDHPFGKIEIEINAPVKSIGDDIETKGGSFLKVKVTIDACIDGVMSAGSLVAVIEMSLNADITLP